MDFLCEERLPRPPSVRKPAALAAKFKQGGSLETQRGKWLLVEAADTATKDRLAKNHGILPLRAIVGEPLHMEDIKSSWFQRGGKGSNTNKQLLSGCLLVGGVKVFKADRTQCFRCKATYVAFGGKPDAPVKEACSTGSRPTQPSATTATRVLPATRLRR